MKKDNRSFSTKTLIKKRWLFASLIVFSLIILTACNPPVPLTPTANPDIYNQTPDSTVFEPGQCTATLDVPAPTYTSNTLGGQPSGEVAAGAYEVGVVADYGSAVFYMLNDAPAPANWIAGASASSLSGACANPLAAIEWQVTDYADPNNSTGMTNVLMETTLSANFGADNVISGSAGCNSYAGAYQLEGQSLTIPGPLTTTQMACAEEVMAQETVFLTNLQAVAGYKLDDVEPQLHLLNSKGQVIILLKKP